MLKLQEEFVPHPLVRGGQMQTILGYALAKKATRASSRRDVVWLADGDAIALDVNDAEKSEFADKSRGPIVLLMHGLGGCSESAYLLRISEKLNRAGMMTIRMNHRGCGREALPAKKIYHSGSVSDLLAVLEYVEQHYPDRPILLIAFSLSATITLNALGRLPDLCDQLGNWRHSIAVCPPLDLERSSRKIARLSNRHIDLYYTRALIEHCRTRYPAIYARRLAGQRLWRWNLRSFDEFVTAPEGGFVDRSDYYARCSPKTYLAKVRKPTTLLAAMDDPVVCTDALPRLEHSAALELVLTRSGGHMGFLNKYPTCWHDYFWMDAFLVDRAKRIFDAY